MTNPLEHVSKITELNDLHEFLEDPELDEALELVIKLITKPEVPAPKAGPLAVKLQAISAMCQLKAAYYSTIGKGPAGSPNNHRKNIYYSMYHAIDNVVASLKYLAR